MRETLSPPPSFHDEIQAERAIPGGPGLITLAAREVRQAAEVASSDTIEEIFADIHQAEHLKTAEKLRSELDHLAELYRDRTDRETFPWTNRTEEVERFATRTADGGRIEELYTIGSNYSSVLSKDYKTTHYAVDLFGDTSRQRIVIPEGGEVRVFEISDGQSQQLSGSAAKDVIDDFYFRSIIAMTRVEERTADERHAANADALHKLHLHVYGRPKRVTATE